MKVHLLGKHMVAYKARDDLNNVVQNPNSQRFMLTEYFSTNMYDPGARKYLYREFPEHFTWIKSKKFWKPRERGGQIGRLVYAHPAEGERYYLRVLLNHVRGATSFEYLRSRHGTTYATFRDACEALGYVETDKSLDDCLTESAQFKMPCALRRLFATIIVFCECNNVRALWDKHIDSVFEDYRRSNCNSKMVEQMVLRDISIHVKDMGRDITNYGFLELDASGKLINIKIPKNFFLSII
jgi:hypothetical protein